MVKKIYRKTTDKGTAIKYQMERGLINAQISKPLGIPESTIHYYLKKSENLEKKRSSKLDKKYNEEIYCLGANKITRKCLEG